VPLQSLLSPLSDELTKVEAVNRLIKRLRLLILSGVFWFILLVIAFLAQIALPDHNHTNFSVLNILIIGLLTVNLINGMLAGWTVFNVINLLQQSQQKLTAHTQALSRRSLQMATASLVARDATIADDLETLLNHTARLITDRFGFYHTGIFLVDVNQEYAQLRAASSGEPSQSLLQKDHKLKVGEEGIVGYVTATGEARIALDVADDKKHYRNPVLPKTRSEIAIPFKVYDKVIGALDVQSEGQLTTPYTIRCAGSTSRSRKQADYAQGGLSRRSDYTHGGWCTLGASAHQLGHKCRQLHARRR
jgi:putative methionine-R-sulfoxide reductase with GAF domain